MATDDRFDNEENTSGRGKKRRIYSWDDYEEEKDSFRRHAGDESDSGEPEESAETAEDWKKRRSNARERRQKQLRKRVILTVAVMVGVVAALIFALTKSGSYLSGGKQNSKETEAVASVSGSSAASETTTEVLHLSFPKLAIDGETTPDGVLTVSEFKEILEKLYEDDYVLVDFYSLTSLTDSDGYQKEALKVPAGKKPLIISQRDVSYGDSDESSDLSEYVNYADGIEINSSGELVNDDQTSDGTTKTGAFDVITCVDEFVAENPDFSVDGARGILALTGSDGVLGYSVSDSAQTAALSNVINKLKDEGWILGCYTYGGISYGSEVSLVREDLKKWEKEADPVIGDTDILIFPGQGDIGSWDSYSSSNEKFELLSEAGFVYFCIDNPEEMYWMQTGDDYVRVGIHEIDNKEEFDTLMNEGIEAYSTLVQKEALDAAEKRSDADSTTDQSTTDEESSDSSEDSGGNGSDSSEDDTQKDSGGSDSEDQDIENIDSEV
ncbi:MAG: hypothetical protein ACOYBC_02975 [Bilifractor sp.]